MMNYVTNEPVNEEIIQDMIDDEGLSIQDNEE